MKLRKLIKDLPVEVVKGSREIEITGISSNSKLVAPGNLFIAKKGLTHDGTQFVADAVSAGAHAILSTLYDPFLPEEVAQIIHPDVVHIEAELAKIYYQFPTEKLFLIGITGTNGKTTTSYLIRHLFESLNTPCGLIGTVEWIAGQHHYPSLYTAPDLLTNYKLFQEMVQGECKAAVMEVSSHGLVQERVKGIEFDVAVFTNLTQDHLDYHKTMENYADAKAKLFTALGKCGNKKSHVKTAVVNVDAEWASHLVRECHEKMITYGIEKKADLMAYDIALSPEGMRFSVQYQQKNVRFFSPLIGRFNVYNCLAAIGVGIAYGFPLDQLPAIFRTFKNARGRLERVGNTRGLNIFVDYAHTDDALKNVLEALGEIKRGKLITVFGCGGNRDAVKRPLMGRVCETHSDICIVTTDNPRTEDPDEIIRQILTGFKGVGQAIVLTDRRQAIKKAIQLASDDDIILIAGKGHETVQIFSHQTIHFDDRAVAAEFC